MKKPAFDRKILLVEDSFEDADLVIETIGNKYHITHVPNVNKALKLLEGIKFDVVLLDLGLPDSDGIEETIDSVKARSAGAAVVVMSGMESDRAVFEAAEAGATDFISKTRTMPSEWIPRIEHAIKHPEPSFQDTVLRAARDNLTYAKRAMRGQPNQWNASA